MNLLDYGSSSDDEDAPRNAIPKKKVKLPPASALFANDGKGETDTGGKGDM